MNSQNDFFPALLTLTAEKAGVPESAIPVSKGVRKRWLSLADFWKSHPSIFSNVFFLALHHIALGHYPNGSAPLAKLLELIEQAILFDPQALSVWRTHDVFSISFNQVIAIIQSARRQRSKSIRRFTYCRLYLHTFYREDLAGTFNLATASPKEFRKAKAIACIKHDATVFEKIITTLVPSAQNWTSTQWVSESHIFACIKALHGVDYAANPREFDLLCTMLKEKDTGGSYCRSLFLIKNIPSSMATCIWPQNLEAEVCKQFRAISMSKPRMVDGNYLPAFDGAAPANVSTSWAFRQLEIWRKNASKYISASMRSKMLKFALGDHPLAI